VVQCWGALPLAKLLTIAEKQAWRRPAHSGCCSVHGQTDAESNLPVPLRSSDAVSSPVAADSIFAGPALWSSLSGGACVLSENKSFNQPYRSSVFRGLRDRKRSACRCRTELLNRAVIA